MPDPHGNEEWRPVVGYEAFYSVSNHGRVRRDAGGQGTRRGTILKPCFGELGHSFVNLCVNSKAKLFAVHRLVLFAFVGEPKINEQGRHFDGNARNNHVDNLLWGTRVENEGDKKRHGTSPTGSRHHMAKLTEPDIEVILCLRKRGWTQTRVATAFGVARGTIASIDQGINWPHVPRP